MASRERERPEVRIPPVAPAPGSPRSYLRVDRGFLRLYSEAMPSRLLVVGGGLFGSMAAQYARSKGVEVTVFDAGLAGAASPAAAGLFKEGWVGKKLRHYYDHALPLLEKLYGVRHIVLT